MNKKIGKFMTTAIMTAVMVIMIFVNSSFTVVAATTSEDNIPSENTLMPRERTVVESDDLDVLSDCLKDASNRCKSAHELAEAVRALGYDEDHIIIQFAKKEYEQAKSDYFVYKEAIQEVKQALWEQKMDEKAKEYPVAVTIWRYWKEQGYNDYVCAGIMGNLMAEVGGQTLDIQYWLYGDGYYGMCQWNMGYKQKIWGLGLEEQLAFLNSTIEYEMDMFGFVYQKGFKYKDFLNLTSERDAAAAFALCYERCGNYGYGFRQDNATAAYNYFVN